MIRPDRVQRVELHDTVHTLTFLRHLFRFDVLRPNKYNITHIPLLQTEKIEFGHSKIVKKNVRSSFKVQEMYFFLI